MVSLKIGKNFIFKKISVCVSLNINNWISNSFFLKKNN